MLSSFTLMLLTSHIKRTKACRGLTLQSWGDRRPRARAVAAATRCPTDGCIQSCSPYTKLTGTFSSCSACPHRKPTQHAADGGLLQLHF